MIVDVAAWHALGILWCSKMPFSIRPAPTIRNASTKAPRQRLWRLRATPSAATAAGNSHP